jgi:hypothetical protein
MASTAVRNFNPGSKTTSDGVTALGKLLNSTSHGSAPPRNNSTLIVCQLTLAGIGWNTTGDAQLAADAADRARAHRQVAKEQRITR